MGSGSSAIELVEEKDGVSVYKSKKGVMRLWCPAAHVVATHIAGYFDAGLEEPFMSRADRVVEDGYRFVAFHDWAEMTGYDSSVRLSLTAWSAQHRRAGHLKIANILVRAKIVAMGVSVAGMMMGGSLDAYSDPAAYKAAFERECKIKPEFWRRSA